MLKKVASVLILVILGICLLYSGWLVFEKKQVQSAEGLYKIARTELLNKIIAEKNLHSYVEIGLNNPYANYTNIIAEEKYSVDPYLVNGFDFSDDESFKHWLPYCTHRMTSDEFFAQNKDKFDIFFIDGLHEESQCDKDIQNALQAVNVGGYVVVRDVLPRTEAQQSVPRNTNGIWVGDVWKSFYKVAKMHNPNLEIFLVNKERGLGVIHKLADFNYNIPKDDGITYKEYLENVHKTVEIISMEDLDKKLK